MNDTGVICEASGPDDPFLDPDELIEDDARFNTDDAPYDDVPIGEMNAGQLLDLLQRARRVTARWEATIVAATACFAEFRERQGEMLAEFAADELAVTLVQTPVEASNRMHHAQDLVTRLPATMARFSQGDLDARQAEAIREVTAPLSVEKAREVEARILEKAPHLTVGRLRQRLRYHVAKVDPDGAAERRRRRQRERTVELNPKDDGMASLYALLPAEHAQAAFHRICGLAAKAKTRGMNARPSSGARTCSPTCCWAPTSTTCGQRSKSWCPPPSSPEPRTNPENSPATDPSTPTPSATSPATPPGAASSPTP
ncbi:MAG: DUF222 domain-containing protein [Pseudonocardiaceae bacterium]|nr:DUF222 domain-containing protein [Pseudonocardiaceae bacterium]